jgi:nucleoside-diphosphate-sugar epimerase
MATNDLAKSRDWYRGRTAVITGGYGYIGDGLSAALREAGCNLRRVTRGRPGIAGGKEAWTGDLTDPVFCVKLVEGADAVFHLSGQTSVPAAEQDPVGDLKANVRSTLTLLAACQQAGRHPAFIHAGTVSEIGLTLSVPVPADTVDRPITVHDAHKLAAEHAVRLYTGMKAVHGVTLRLANVYGPGPAASAADRGVLNKMIGFALAGKTLTYYGDGAMIRDYVYIDDVIAAFLMAAPAAANAALPSYAIGSGEGHRISDAFSLVADVVASLGRPRVAVVSAPWPPDHHVIDRRSFVADTAPFTAFCGWRPSTKLPEGIRRTAETWLRRDRAAEPPR